jgi:hypothetical protein
VNAQARRLLHAGLAHCAILPAGERRLREKRSGVLHVFSSFNVHWPVLVKQSF